MTLDDDDDGDDEEYETGREASIPGGNRQKHRLVTGL
jgi:hypothetical protein